MAQIPILSGIYSDEAADLRVALPVNLMPTVVDSGLSKGYLRPADGIVPAGIGPGISRGGIAWNGTVYRVMGSKLISISSAGVVTVLADVGTGTQCFLDYGFDRLAILSNGVIYYWNGSTLTSLTNGGGAPISMVWIDGYYAFTDGTYVVVTSLADPTVLLPYNYSSSQLDPNPMVAVLKLRGDLITVNRYTVETLVNIGGSYFPYQRQNGAQIMRGAVGSLAAIVFHQEFIAFVGSGRGEALGVYLGQYGQSSKISNREIDTLLTTYTDAQTALIQVEQKVYKGVAQLWVHLPDRTLVYDHLASQASGSPVWFQLVSTSTPDTFSLYRGKDLVYCYGQWNIADPLTQAFGTMSDKLSSQWGNLVRWEFSTGILYNESHGALVHSLELMTLPGRYNQTDAPMVSSAYSIDGEKWSSERYISAGTKGQTDKRMVWLQQGYLRKWRIQRFRGTSETFLSVARLDAEVEGLNV